MSDAGEFSVYQFFANEQFEAVRCKVNAQTAVRWAHTLAASIGGRTGRTQRIIITDSGDHTVFEWQYGRGVVFPPRQPGIPGSSSAISSEGRV